MVIMPILNTNKNNVTRIYNVEVKLRNATMVRESVQLKNMLESDIMIGGLSFNESIYNEKKKEDNAMVNFIRNTNLRCHKDEFLITTRSHIDSDKYDLYSIEIPPKKVTSGLDNLLGRLLLDIQKRIPGMKKGRYISLRRLGVEEHITNEKLEKLQYIVKNCKDKSRWKYLFFTNGISNLKDTLDFLNLFEFTIIDEATMKEEKFKEMLSIFSYTNGKDYINLKNYYAIAKENQEVYQLLTYMNRLIYDKPLNLITSKKKSKILVKANEQTA